MSDISITFNDGRQVLVPYNSSYYDLSLKESNSNNIIGVLIGGKVLSLDEKITKNTVIKFIDITNPYGNGHHGVDLGWSRNEEDNSNSRGSGRNRTIFSGSCCRKYDFYIRHDSDCTGDRRGS